MSDSGGLYVEVAPGGGRWWRLKYRYGGKEKRLSLGVYLDVSLKDARDRRDDASKLLAVECHPKLAHLAGQFGMVANIPAAPLPVGRDQCVAPSGV